jgi:tripartite-type tricarboxylate transporter receptor subunit TctC
MNIHSSLRRILIITVLAVSLGAPSLEAAAQAFPSKPIRLLVPTGPGGGTDAIGRVLANTLTVSLKQQVVVDNKPGASGVIASEATARAPADGYTLMITQNGHTVNPATIKKLPYDTFNDFTPISPLARSPMVLISAAPSGIKTFKDMTELGKRTPSGMSVAAADNSTRLATEMISGATGIPMSSVYYKGTSPAVTDVAGGHINFSITTIASTLSQRGSGKVNYVAVLAPERSSFLPEVPTLTEQGLTDIDVSAWWSIIAPANLPKPIVQTLNSAIRAALADPEVKKRLATLSAEPWSASSDDFDKFIRKEAALIAKLAKKAGIEPN